MIYDFSLSPLSGNNSSTVNPSAVASDFFMRGLRGTMPLLILLKVCTLTFDKTDNLAKEFGLFTLNQYKIALFCLSLLMLVIIHAKNVLCKQKNALSTCFILDYYLYHGKLWI